MSKFRFIRPAWKGSNMSAVDVEFIRIFFPSPIEEEVAIRWAKRLASVIGERVEELRPNSLFSEIFDWVKADGFDVAEFVMALEDEFGKDLDVLLDDLDHLTFRGFVEYMSKTSPKID